MPKGIVHDSITKKQAPKVAVVTLALSLPLGTYEAFTIAGLTTLSFLFAGFMFSGDLDLPSRQTRRWGLLKFIWIPYQKMFPHRSTFTHGIILGPIIRILYLYLVILLTWLGLSIWLEKDFAQIFEITYSLISTNWLITLSLLLGIVLGGASHSIADWTLDENGEKKNDPKSKKNIAKKKAAKNKKK